MHEVDIKQVRLEFKWKVRKSWRICKGKEFRQCSGKLNYAGGFVLNTEGICKSMTF